MVQCSLFPIPLFLGLQNENAEKNISTIVSRSKFYLVHIILLLNSHLDLMSEEKIGILKITLHYIILCLEKYLAIHCENAQKVWESRCLSQDGISCFSVILGWSDGVEWISLGLKSYSDQWKHFSPSASFIDVSFRFLIFKMFFKINS